MFGDHMVLQRAPQRAIVWGFADTVGDTVTVLKNGVLMGQTTVDRYVTGKAIERPPTPRRGQALTIKKGMGMLPGDRDPYPFPDTIEISKMNIYPIVDKQNMLICSVS